MGERGGRRPFGEKKRLRRSITPDQEAWNRAVALAVAYGHNSVSQLFDALVNQAWEVKDTETNSSREQTAT